MRRIPGAPAALGRGDRRDRARGARRAAPAAPRDATCARARVNVEPRPGRRRRAAGQRDGARAARIRPPPAQGRALRRRLRDGACRRAGVLATGKHFPGFGAARANTDNVAGHDPHAAQAAARGGRAPLPRAVPPRRAARDAEHRDLPGLDPGVPAAFSRRIARRELRGRLGLSRRVDDRRARHARDGAVRGPAEVGVRAARAGVDLMLYSSYAAAKAGRARHRARDPPRAHPPLARGGVGPPGPRGQAQPAVDRHALPPRDVRRGGRRGHGLTRVATVGIDEDAIGTALALADAHDEVFAIVGRHPNSATGIRAFRSRSDQARGRASEGRGDRGDRPRLLPRPRAARRPAARVRSADRARARARQAARHPHARGRGGHARRCSPSARTGSPSSCTASPRSDRLDECVERGYMCSFAGNVTYPKATDLQEAAARVPGRAAARRDRCALPGAAARAREAELAARTSCTRRASSPSCAASRTRSSKSSSSETPRASSAGERPGQHPPAARVRRPPEPRARPELPDRRQRAAAGRGRGRAVAVRRRARGGRRAGSAVRASRAARAPSPRRRGGPLARAAAARRGRPVRQRRPSLRGRRRARHGGAATRRPGRSSRTSRTASRPRSSSSRSRSCPTRGSGSRWCSSRSAGGSPPRRARRRTARRACSRSFRAT